MPEATSVRVEPLRLAWIDALVGFGGLATAADPDGHVGGDVRQWELDLRREAATAADAVGGG